MFRGPTSPACRKRNDVRLKASRSPLSSLFARSKHEVQPDLLKACRKSFGVPAVAGPACPRATEGLRAPPPTSLLEPAASCLPLSTGSMSCCTVLSWFAIFAWRRDSVSVLVARETLQVQHLPARRRGNKPSHCCGVLALWQTAGQAFATYAAFHPRRALNPA